MWETKEMILKIAKEIEKLNEEKDDLERKIDETLKEVSGLNRDIFEAEKDVRKAAKEKLTRHCHERFKDEIKMLKRQQKTAETLYDTYEKQLRRAIKEYEECGKVINGYRE